MKKLVYFGGGGSGGFTWTVIELLSENVVLFIKWAGPDPLWAAVGVLLRRIRRRRRRKRNGNRNLNGIGVGAGKLCESLRLWSFGALALWRWNWIRNWNWNRNWKEWRA